MADGPLTATLRKTFTDLKALLAQRADRERDVAQSRDRAMSAALAAFEAARLAAEDARDSGLAAAKARHESTRDSTVKRHEQESTTLQRAYDSDKAITKERAEADLAKATRKAEEAVWMAESLYDTTKEKPRLDFDAQMKERDALLKQIKTDEAQAVQILTENRCGKLAPAAPGATTSEAPAAPADHAGALKESAAEVRALVTKLDGLILPRAGGGAMPFVWSVAGIAIGGTVGMWLAKWQPDIPMIGTGAGVGLAIGIIIAIILFIQARKSAALVTAPLAVAIGRARTTAEVWQLHASAVRKALEEDHASKRDKEVEVARIKVQKVKEEATRTGNERMLALRQSREAEKVKLAQKREADLAAAHARFKTQSDHAAEKFAADSRAAQSTRDGALADAESTHAADFAALRDWWQSNATAATQTLAAVNAANSASFPGWSDAHWDRVATSTDPRGYTPPSRSAPATPIGALSVLPSTLPGSLPTDERLAIPGLAPDSPISFPSLLELPDRCSLLIQTGGEGHAAAISVLQNTMLRILAAMPPGKVRFTIVDPVGLGQNFAGFMHLADYDPLLVADKIWTEPRHIEARLTDLTEHMETVIQKYLRNQFASIEEYNVHAGEIAEPYRFLVIADLPTNFNEIAAKRLASIISSGARCGVYVLIAMDTRQPMPQGLSAQDLERAVTSGGACLVWKRTPTGQPGLVYEDPDFGPLNLSLEAPPDEARANAIIHMVGRASKDVGRVRVPFETIAPAPDRMWTLSTTSEFRVPMGRAGATKLQDITLGKGTAQHALIAGRTGSGKSTLLHAIITNTALWYSPDEVEMYLVDFKKGVEFKTYASRQMPHARVIAIESEREFGLSVLRKLDAELKRRGTLYRDEGVQDLAGFRRAKPDFRMPRILLLVDEFQELFVEDDKLAQESGLLLDRLVRQGRAFGMHVVLGSQTLGGAYSLAKATIGQMAVRIALACSEADAYLIMSDDNAAPRLLSRPGEAIYNDQSGAVEGNSPFQVAFLPDEQRDDFLDRVTRKQEEALRANPAAGAAEPPIIFEGSVPAAIERNYLLNDLLNRTQWPPATSAPAAWLGDAIAIKDPTAALFKRQAAANLLIVGQRDEAATAMLTCAMIELAAQHAPLAIDPTQCPQMFLLDGTPADSTLAGFLARAASVLPHAVSVVEYRQVDQAMERLATELDKRQQAEASGGDLGSFHSVYVIVNGLQRFRMLRRAEDEFDFSSTADDKAQKPDKIFARLLREGPAAGMHVLLWCDTVGSLNRTLDRTALREFDSRVLFQMSQADSSALIDAAVAGTIGQNRALYYSEEQGLVEKFRPWALPDDAWLERVRKAMRRDGTSAAVR